MPVVQCSWPELESTITSLEKGRHEILQIVESPQGVAILYRRGSKVETRGVKSAAEERTTFTAASPGYGDPT